ncbi:MAG: hypothetical protein HY560_10920 [Gemmatimonadetes bacterium]|nr:hypothetical protein [Gemmatimonadota bacterium]
MLQQAHPFDRRSTDRRLTDRRHLAVPVGVERRAAERRAGIDRREPAPAHIRNALQVLQEVEAHLRGDPEGTQKLNAAARRLWLALNEMERRGATDPARTTIGTRFHSQTT